MMVSFIFLWDFIEYIVFWYFLSFLGFVKGCPNDSTRIYPETYSTLNLTPYHYVDDIDELKGLNPTKALFIKHDDNERNAIYEHVMEEKLFTDLHLSKTLSHDDKYYQVYLEFMHPE